jgi:cytochrome P450
MFSIIDIYPEEAYRLPIVERHFRGRRHLLINHPEGVGHVLQHNVANYVKGRKMQRILMPIMGHSLITTEGDDWQRQRRIIAPAFRHASITTFVPLFAAKAAALRAEWERRAIPGPVDMVAEMQRLALAVFGAAMFGTEMKALEPIPATARRYLRHAQAVEKLITLGLPERIGLAINHRLARATARPLRAIAEMLRETPADARPVASLLAMLQEAQRQETGQMMSVQEVEDQIATLLLAGHSTSAGTLCWLWYLLDLCPPVRERLDAELADVLDGRLPTVEDLPRLSYTRMVIDEVMRLYPIIPTAGFEALAADEICGVPIAAGTRVTVSPWLVHRNRGLWPEAEMFVPERFAPERRGAIPRYAHIPFGAGPRICIGAAFAVTEMMVIVATLAQRFAPRVVPGHRIEVMSRGDLQPRYGMPMLLDRRG